MGPHWYASLVMLGCIVGVRPVLMNLMPAQCACIYRHHAIQSKPRIGMFFGVCLVPKRLMTIQCQACSVGGSFYKCPPNS